MNRPDSLRSNKDFLRLWIGQTISVFGSRIDVLALPLTAVLTLHASAIQMGVLAGADPVGGTRGDWDRSGGRAAGSVEHDRGPGEVR